MQNQDSSIKFIIQRRIALISSIILLCKVGAYFLTNSVGILTDALESIVNVITGFVSLYAIAVSLKPKDKDHPYGHGKIESISASLEGILILIAGLIIIFEAIKRFFIPSEIQQLDIGILLVALAGLINYIIGYYSIKTGKKYNSIALIAGGKHLHSDTYSSIGLVIGLMILYFTKILWIDSLIAISFGTIIVYTGYKILKETTSNLMDKADFQILNNITNVIWEHKSENWVEIKNMKILKFGDSYHVDCDLTLPWYYNINEAHIESDKLVDIINKNISESIDLTVHTDACKPEYCSICSKNHCESRKEIFLNEKKWTVENVIQKNILK